MALIEINDSTNQIPEVVSRLGDMALYLQAIGGIVLLWLIFQIISLFINYKKKKQLETIEARLKKIEKKVNEIKTKK